jgi:hypothetical protein
MDTNGYMIFLLVGLLLVVIDGQIIYRSGRRYLASAEGDPESGVSMARLVTVLFHLVVLGVLALLTTIDFGDDTSMQAVVRRLGVMLLVLAVAHGVTAAILSGMRDEQVGQALATRRSEATVVPVPGQEGIQPSVSPPLEHGVPDSSPRG